MYTHHNQHRARRRPPATRRVLVGGAEAQDLYMCIIIYIYIDRLTDRQTDR